MADVTQTLSLLILAQNYAGDIKRQINRRSVMLGLMPVVRGEGKNVAWVAESSGAIAESYTDGADAANFGTDAQAQAVLNWSLTRSNWHVSGLAQAAAATSATPFGNIELWKRAMFNGMIATADKLNKDLYTGAGGAGQIVGLDLAIGSVSNTYAGIDRTTEAYWRPYVVDPGVATPITFELIRTDMAEIYKQCGSRPDIAFCSPSVFLKIAGLFDPQKQYLISTVPSRGRGDSLELDGGAGALKFDTMYVVEDKDAPEGTMYYLNSEHVRFEYLPAAPPVLGMADETLEMMGTDGVVEIPLGFRIEGLAKNGDSDRASLKTYAQLVVDRPNSCGVRKNIDV